MRINEDIIRHLTVRVEALEEEPSAMMRARDQRDERPGRGDRFGSERGDRFGGGGFGGDRDRPRRPRGDEGPSRDAGSDEGIGGPT